MLDKKLYNRNRKNTVCIIALLIMLLMSLATFALPTANAAALNFTTKTFLSLRPNPIGVGQSLLVAMWITPPPPTRSLIFHNFTIQITKPSGTVETKGPMDSFEDASNFFQYVPTEVGTYKFKFLYPGETFPKGTPYQSQSSGPFDRTLPNDMTYSADTSPIIDLVVQNTPIQYYPAAALPTGYWQRPVSAENREWYTLLSTWPSFDYGPSHQSFNPYTAGPESPHILWTQQWRTGGLVGGELGGNFMYYIQERGTPSLDAVIAGLGYYYDTGNPVKLHCIDIRTGAERWARENITFTAAKNEIGFQGGARGAATAEYTAMLVSIGSRLQKYDAYSGDLIQDVPGMSGLFADPYVYTLQNLGGKRFLIKWSTDEKIYVASQQAAQSANFTERIVYNVTYPLTGVSGIDGNIGYYLGTVAATTGIPTMSGAFDTRTGQMLWSRNATVYDPDSRSSQNGIAFGWTIQGGLRGHAGLDLKTGNLLYSSEGGDYPWSDFWGYDYAAAYGYFYELSYDGHVYAFNAQDGKIAWEAGFRDSGFETPYGHYPFFFSIVVADGKVYVSNEEHSPTSPLWRGSLLYCFNATTGACIWNITTWSSKQVIADGLLILVNLYDNLRYCYGKGLSATTVTAPQTEVAFGSKVLIEGTVTDQSPGQTSIGIPAAGTPAVSDESMRTWMEYLYMQKPKPTNATGVKVHIIAIDPNGNWQEIGNALSDSEGNYAIAWKPPVPGLYKVKATFEGSNSYYSSQAGTAFIVSDAPSASAVPTATLTPINPITTPTGSPIVTATPTTVPLPPNSQAPTTTYIAIGFAIVIIVAAATALTLRRRK